MQTLGDLSFFHLVVLPSEGPSLPVVQQREKAQSFEESGLEVMYLTCAQIPSARTQSPDPKLTSWIVFKSIVLKKWKIK